MPRGYQTAQLITDPAERQRTRRQFEALRAELTSWPYPFVDDISRIQFYRLRSKARGLANRLWGDDRERDRHLLPVWYPQGDRMHDAPLPGPRTRKGTI